jgi:hypothetical protein
MSTNAIEVTVDGGDVSGFVVTAPEVDDDTTYGVAVSVYDNPRERTPLITGILSRDETLSLIGALLKSVPGGVRDDVTVAQLVAGKVG